MIVIVNANYHCRLMEKMPLMKIRRNSVTEFMKKYNIAIPEPMPVKPVLLRLIREANVWKQYIVDKNAKTSICSVLWLPSYHCMLNHKEIVWSQMKQHVGNKTSILMNH